MKQQPLLMDELTPTERVSLSLLKQNPGFSTLEKLIMASCRRATEAVIKLDPIEEGYERKLKALQSQARERNEFSLLLLQSIDWQIQVESIRQEEQEDKPEENPILRQSKRTEQ